MLEVCTDIYWRKCETTNEATRKWTTSSKCVQMIQSSQPPECQVLVLFIPFLPYSTRSLEAAPLTEERDLGRYYLPVRVWDKAPAAANAFYIILSIQLQDLYIHMKIHFRQILGLLSERVNESKCWVWVELIGLMITSTLCSERRGSLSRRCIDRRCIDWHF